MVAKLFIDTNVFLDFLMQRGNDWQNAEAIFKMAESGVVKVFTSSSSLINVMYVMQTCKLSREEVIANTNAILSFTTLVDPDNTTFEIALLSGFKDLEDAVQYHTALEINGVNYFITSNIKDYGKAHKLLPVITPGEYIDIHGK